VTKGAWRVPKWRAFVVSQVVLLGETVIGKQYSCVSASTTWTRGGLVLPIPRDKSRDKSLLPLTTLYMFPHYSLAILACLSFPRVVSC
jgi:hypothetical protein